QSGAESLALAENHVAIGATPRTEKQPLAGCDVAVGGGVDRRSAQRPHEGSHGLQLRRRKVEARHAGSGKAVPDHCQELLVGLAADAAVVREILPAFGAVAVALTNLALCG